MKKYKVYFEFFGRKMKTEIFANDKLDAKVKIAEMIKFHKVETIEETMYKDLKDIFPFL